MRRSGVYLLLLALLIASLLAGCQAATPTQQATPTAEPIKVALLLYGPLADTGWNATAYQGLLAAQEEFGVEIALSEDVQIPDIEQAIRDYASQGYDLIIGHSFPFMDPMIAVAPEFPDTKFAVTNGYLSAENVASFYPREVESHYLAGVLCGLMTKSNVIGIVGGVELPNLVANFNAFKQGVASVNPDAQVLISYVGDWGDPAGGKEAALAQINNGADILLDEAAGSGLGVLEACQEHDIPVISYVGLDSDAAPPQMVASILPDFVTMIKHEVELVVKGQFVGQVERPDLASGIVDLFMNENVPPEVRAKVEEAKQAIINGEIVVEEVYE